MEVLNLHLTGDFHAVTAAHNLLSAVLDNHLYQGNTSGIDPHDITWRPVLDVKSTPILVPAGPFGVRRPARRAVPPGAHLAGPTHPPSGERRPHTPCDATVAERHRDGRATPRLAWAIAAALVSAAIAFLSSLVTALQGEHTGFDTITDGQWVTAWLAALIPLGTSGGVTLRVTNRPAPSLTGPAANG